MRPKNPDSGVNSIIYALTDSIGTIRYIGYTKNDLTYAVNHHRSAAKAMRKSTPVNQWIAEIGLHEFKGEVLEKLKADDDTEDRLAWWVDYARANDHPLLNLTKEEHMRRVRAAMGTPEVRAKVAAANSGRTHSAEWRAKISAANKGRVLTAEHRENISKAQKGKVVSEETRAKIAAKAMGHQRNLGRRHTEETKAKMSHTKVHTKKGVVDPDCMWC